MQLSPFAAIGSGPGQAVLQSLFGSPFQISCINAKPVTQSKCKSVRYAETSGEQVAVPADEGSLPETSQRGPHQWTDAQNSFSALASQEAGKDDEDGMGAPETTPAPPTWLYPRKRKQNLKLTTKNGCTARCGSKCSADALEFVNFKVSKFDSIETIVSTELSDLAKSKLEFDDFGEPLGRPCRSSCGCMGACDENGSLKWDASGKVTRRSSETATSRCNPLMMFNQVHKAQNLMPVSQKEELKTRLGKFEILTAIVDSGATVPVMNPNTGASYDVIPASANGTEYEIASGDTLEDLGEKKMVVLTVEGTLRGYSTRCADVTKSLQAVRALVKSNHAVCFGLGEGEDHLIINKITGEINRMRDDGINYLQDLIIVPPEQVDQVASKLAAMQLSYGNNNDGNGMEQSFGWQGR